MKVVYIAHPISGDIEANLADIRRIVALINRTMPDVVPFVPYYVDVVSLDDNDPADRARGIKNDHHLLRSGVVDEMWATGERLSIGMKEEIRVAYHLGIPVKFKIKEL